jgi:hypothetical protein
MMKHRRLFAFLALFAFLFLLFLATIAYFWFMAFPHTGMGILRGTISYTTSTLAHCSNPAPNTGIEIKPLVFGTGQVYTLTTNAHGGYHIRLPYGDYLVYFPITLAQSPKTFFQPQINKGTTVFTGKTTTFTGCYFADQG